MKKLLMIITMLLLLSGCEVKVVEQNSFDIGEYKGFVIIEKLEDEWNDRDFYIIKNDSVIVKLQVPIFFGIYYSIGDTIK